MTDDGGGLSMRNSRASRAPPSLKETAVGRGPPEGGPPVGGASPEGSGRWAGPVLRWAAGGRGQSGGEPPVGGARPERSSAPAHWHPPPGRRRGVMTPARRRGRPALARAVPQGPPWRRRRSPTASGAFSCAPSRRGRCGAGLSFPFSSSVPFPAPGRVRGTSAARPCRRPVLGRSCSPRLLPPLPPGRVWRINPVCLSLDPQRLDGRQCYDYRNVRVSFGADYGCCIVELGKTRWERGRGPGKACQAPLWLSL